MRGYGPDIQWLDDVIPAAPVLGLHVSEQYRRIIQESATGWERSKFEVLMREALTLFQSGKIQALLFPRVDRETRFIFSSFPLLAEVVRGGLPVYFAKEKLLLDPTDTESIERYLMKTVQSQAYIETMKTNMMRGKRQRALSGKLAGGAYLYGYNYNKETGTRLINEYESGIVKKIFNWLVRDGLSCREICKRLTLEDIPTPHNNTRWGRSTIGRIVHNESYTGVTYYFKTIGAKGVKRVARVESERVELPDVTPPIISPELFQLAQQQLIKNRASGPGTRINQYLLTGYLFCGKCGKRYHGVPSHHKAYYRCSSHSDMTVYCHNKVQRADKLDAGIWRELVARTSDINDLISRAKKRVQGTEKLDHLQKEIESRRERIIKHRDNAERIIKLYAMTETYDLKEGASKVDKINRDIKALEREIALLESQIKESARFNVDIKKLREWHKLFLANIENADFDQKRRALKYFNAHIIVLGDNVELVIDVPSVT
jgi:site-specific DNA recombinase